MQSPTVLDISCQTSLISYIYTGVTGRWNCHLIYTPYAVYQVAGLIEKVMQYVLVLITTELEAQQMKLYHGSVGIKVNYEQAITSGSVHWCSCCHRNSEAIRKHMHVVTSMSIKALSLHPNTCSYVNEPTFNLTWDQSVTCLERIKFCSCTWDLNQLPGHMELQPLLLQSYYGAHAPDTDDYKLQFSHHVVGHWICKELQYCSLHCLT